MEEAAGRSGTRDLNIHEALTFSEKELPSRREHLRLGVIRVEESIYGEVRTRESYIRQHQDGRVLKQEASGRRSGAPEGVRMYRRQWCVS